MKKIMIAGLSIICITCVAIFVYNIFLRDEEEAKNKKTYQEIKNKAGVELNNKPDQEELVYSFNDLLKINADAWGYIYIPNTQVDYPIVQGSDNDYYLHHDFHKNQSSYGTIFVDSRCMDSRNTILYGHHMNNGSMFGDVIKYKDKNFMKKNHKIYLNNHNDQLVLRPIMFLEVKPDDQEAFRVSFQSVNEHQQWVQRLQDRSGTLSGEKYSGNETYTLCTCTNTNNNRYLLICEKGE